MAKEKFNTGGVINENATESDTPEAIIELDKLPELLKATPLSEIMKSIAVLPQSDRLVLYSRFDVIMNEDRQKASCGVDNVGHLFNEAIKSL
jgi:hypothetical protein